MYLLRHGALLLAAVASMTLAGGAGRICPIPTCDSCLEPALQSAPGIGFHLGLCSGAVAISSHDGYVQNAAHVPASSEYISLMQEFTTHPNRLDPPPNTLPARLEHVQRQLQRRANLLLGRPGTPQAGTLASMLSRLRQQVPSHIDIPKGAIGLVLPNSALASLEEVNDALAYAGFRQLHHLQVPDRELNAAFAAYGHGLCDSYTNPYECEKEEAAFPEEIVLHLDYTNETLAANTNWIRSARSSYATTNFVDWSLGRDRAGDGETEKSYWAEVERRIAGLFAASSSRHPFTKILLTGYCASDENFRDVLKNVAPGHAVDVGESSTTMEFAYMPALGSAEMQRRRQQGWTGCVLPKRCADGTLLQKAKVTIQRYLEL